MKYKSDRSADIKNNEVIRRLNEGRKSMKEPMQKGGVAMHQTYGTGNDPAQHKVYGTGTTPAIHKTYGTKKPYGAMNVPSKKKGGSIKDGDGFYVSGVTSDYSNYKAPREQQPRTGKPAPSLKKGGSAKRK